MNVHVLYVLELKKSTKKFPSVYLYACMYCVYAICVSRLDAHNFWRI